MISLDGRLLRLLQLASPMLPVGAYSYSQGLEWALQDGSVRDAASAERWVGDVLRHGLARFEAPLWLRLHQAWADADRPALTYWNELFIASRESAEFRAETLQMGTSLRRLLLDIADLDDESSIRLRGLEPIGFPTAFTLAAYTWTIPAHAALQAYLWGWLENQVSVLMKALPLGQTAGQRLLLRLADAIPAVAEAAQHTETLSNFLPGLAIASCQHETQYSRLFRS
jgi:urease accessory protein